MNSPAPAFPVCAPTVCDPHGLRRANRLRLAQDLLAGRTHLRGKPVHLKLELTNFCNLACPMCPHKTMQRSVGYMKPSLFRRILDEAAPELEFAYVHHLGESLFHPHLPELVAYGSRLGVAMGLSTNATFLTERKGAALLSSGLRFLVISLDATSEESYATMRTGGDFAQTMQHVDRFLSQAASHPDLSIVVQMIVSSQNQHEVQAFARRFPRHVVFKEARDWAGQVPLGTLRPRTTPSSPPQPEPPPSLPCRLPFTELTVLWNGQVVPCANVFEAVNVLGDLSVQSVSDVWNGPPAQKLRRAHLQKHVQAIPICNTCPGHAFCAADFVAVDALGQRLRNYRPGQKTPRPGLS